MVTAVNTTVLTTTATQMRRCRHRTLGPPGVVRTRSFCAQRKLIARAQIRPLSVARIHPVSHFPASTQDRKADTWQDVGSADEQHQKFGIRRQSLRASIPKRLADPRVGCLLRVGTGLLVSVGFNRPSHSFLVAGTGRSVDDISSVHARWPTATSDRSTVPVW